MGSSVAGRHRSVGSTFFRFSAASASASASLLPQLSQQDRRSKFPTATSSAGGRALPPPPSLPPVSVCVAPLRHPRPSVRPSVRPVGRRPTGLSRPHLGPSQNGRPETETETQLKRERERERRREERGRLGASERQAGHVGWMDGC